MSNEDNVIIIGSGVSGVIMACQLQRQLEFTNFEIYEKGASFGGTWWFNTYPGCACDIPSHLYSFSFELNPDWTGRYSSQPEIHKYIENVAKKYNLPSKTHLNTEATGARWDNETARWTVDFKDLKTGNTYSKTCKFLVMATGILSVPNPCTLPGIENFKGGHWHSARWNHSVSLKDKNVIIIGNGCSATQIVPAILPEVKSLTQIIRSQHYLLPLANSFYSDRFKWIMKNIPGVMRLYRLNIAVRLELSFKMFRTKAGAGIRERVSKLITGYMKKVTPEKYHDIVIPKHQLGAKRRVIDSNYLASLHNPKILLTTDSCVQVKEHSIVTKSGAEYPADVIVYANGFQVHTPMVPMKIYGKSGEDIQSRWNRQGGPRGYMGSLVADFPNMFMLVGPNLGTGHFSAIFTTECTINLATKLMDPFLGVKEKGMIELTQEAEDKEFKWIQDNSKDCVWGNGDFDGWYVNKETGHNSTVYPHYQTHYWWKTYRPNWSDFKIIGRKKGNSGEFRLILLAIIVFMLSLVFGWLRK